MIEECAQRLSVKFGDIAKNEGKIDAKMYLRINCTIQYE